MPPYYTTKTNFGLLTSSLPKTLSLIQAECPMLYRVRARLERGHFVDPNRLTQRKFKYNFWNYKIVYTEKYIILYNLYIKCNFVFEIIQY